MLESKFVSKARKLYFEGEYYACLDYIENKLRMNKDLKQQFYYQIYQGLSFYAINEKNDGYDCFKELVDNNSLEKKEVDNVIIRTLWQWNMFDDDKQEAIKINPELLEACNLYKSQMLQDQQWNEDIYNFGMSVYTFIDAYHTKNTNADLSYLQKLIDSLKNTVDFKSEMITVLEWIFDQLNCDDKNWDEILEKTNKNFPGLANRIGLIYDKSMNQDNFSYQWQKDQFHPLSGHLLTIAALFYKYMQDYDSAEELFKKSILVDPLLGITYHHYGEILMDIGKDEEGLNILQIGLEFAPKEILIFKSLMKLEYYNGNYSKSKEYLQSMIEKDPIDGSFEYEYGILEMNKFQDESALEYFRKSLNKRLSEQVMQSCNINIAFIYYEKEDYEKCLEQHFHNFNLNYLQMGDYKEIGNFVQLLNDSDLIPSEQKRIDTINSLFGIVQTRLERIIERSSNSVIIYALMQKQEEFTTILSLLAYFENIQPYLYFMSDLNHWDLFVD